jgi:5-methyltetrahydropteroyltriglutamate--homocysteine methyltransferase
MKRSTERLLTTHTGSLARPATLRDAVGDDYGPALRSAVRDVVRRQVEAGVDIVSDGEMSKPSYATYIAERASGFEGQPVPPSQSPEAVDFPEWGELMAARASHWPPLPACNGEIRRTDTTSAGRGIANLKEAVAAAGATEGFMTAASPGVISTFLENQYYPATRPTLRR